MTNTDNIKLCVRNLNFYYGLNQVLHQINLDFHENQVNALIGPSGSGKSTLLRCFNRMNTLYHDHKITGEILLDNININEEDSNQLRRKVGMVFQKPTPFPMSILQNVAFGIKLHERLKRRDLEERIEWALNEAGLWDEVKDKLNQSGLSLSGGQQQRLCIARAIAIKPEILLLDEPTSSLDPVGTNKIEALIHTLKKEYTIIIVTHNMQQAARVSDYTAFMHMGELIEVDKTDVIFHSPMQQATQDYIAGKYG